jgi:hypothetical protein
LALKSRDKPPGHIELWLWKEDEMKFYEMESIKMILGLPSQASVKQIEARLSELLAKEEELEAIKDGREERENQELATGQVVAPAKWGGLPWVGMGIVILIALYFFFSRR